MSIEATAPEPLEAMRNPNYFEGGGDRTAMQEWRRRSMRAFASPILETNKVHNELQNYESEVARVIFEQFPDLKERASKLLDAEKRLKAESYASRQTRWDEILGGNIGGFGYGGVMELAPNAPPDGWFWWAQTQPTRNDGRLNHTFLSDGLHMFGDIDYDSDPTY